LHICTVLFTASVDWRLYTKNMKCIVNNIFNLKKNQLCLLVYLSSS
jgi:hypothetical protein